MEILMTFCRFRRDENGNPVGEPLYTQVRGKSDDEVNARVMTMRWDNEMDKYTPYTFVRVNILKGE